MIKAFLQRKIIQETMWYTAANICMQLSSLIAVFFVSRYLGPTNLGLYAFVQNYIAVFITLLGGMDIYANWHIVKSHNPLYELRKYIVQKSYIAGCITFFFVLFSFTLLPRDVFFLALFQIIPIWVSVYSSYIFVLQYRKKAKLLGISMALSAFFILCCKLSAVIFSAPLWVFVFINSIEGVLLAVICYAILSKEVHKENLYKIKARDIYQLFVVSTLPIIYTVFWLFVVRLDQFIVPIYFDAKTLGVYSAAVKVIEMTNVLIIILQSVIIPRVFQIESPTNHLSITKMHKVIFLYTLAGIGASVSIYMLAPLAVAVLFGSEFKETVSILQVYAWSAPGLFVSYLFSVIFMAQNAYKKLAYSAVALALFSALLLFAAAQLQAILLIAAMSVVVYTTSAISMYILWRYK
jgi:polysaccharide transporter, PST family